MAHYTLKTKHEGNITISRTYWCPDEYGYVREEHGTNHGTLGRQVGEDLSHSGDMMMASAKTLKSQIQAARRRERYQVQRNEYDHVLEWHESRGLL